jgi:dipeptidyl aminopeptidase/acylaminoacyl peptidase
LSAKSGDTLRPLAEDVLAAVDAAAAQGLIDGRRIAAYGHSYGGYAALGLAATTRRFSAIIASAGIYDLAADYGHFELRTDYLGTGISPSSGGYFEGDQGRMGGPPWTDPQRYISSSPYYSIDKVTAPVMLIHGDIDSVPVTEADRALFALYRLGKDAKLLRYAGEGHYIVSPANLRHQWDEIFRFLDEHVPVAAKR